LKEDASFFSPSPIRRNADIVESIDDEVYDTLAIAICDREWSIRRFLIVLSLF
jgi:hypothetical protein